jgi:hypothetical protein
MKLVDPCATPFQVSWAVIVPGREPVLGVCRMAWMTGRTDTASEW